MDSSAVSKSVNKSISKLQSVHLKPASPLKISVWWVRRTLRDLYRGKDVLDPHATNSPAHEKIRKAYLKVDQFIHKYLPTLVRTTPKKVALKRVRDILELELGYKFAEIIEDKPWGASYRMVNEQAERFIAEFFPNLSLTEARLGRDDTELSPKILLVCPGQRLSWQYHQRRSERWRFLTNGIYYRSYSDHPGEPHIAKQDTVIQFATGERHRLCAPEESYTLVAEIWQHTDHSHPSTEDDIVRLHDDYKR